MPQTYNGWTAEALVAFEVDIAACFERKEIKAPIHLASGNEQQLIDLFADADIGNPDTWCFATHRSHLHALLKGVPREWLKGEILAGRSITINNREHRFFSSAIVGGILPIAVGVSMSGQHVWAFCGDMAGESGLFAECVKYAQGHDLPIHFVVEDNEKSVCTPTREVWGKKMWRDRVIRYSYQNKWPHQGTGIHVAF